MSHAGHNMTVDLPDFCEMAAPGIRSLKPYQPGKPIEELERELGITNIVKLASNENPFGPGVKTMAAIQNASKSVALYPDASGYELKKSLAARHGVDASMITLGNGSNDVLVLLAETFLTPRHDAIYSHFAFAVYPITVQTIGATPRVAQANSPDTESPFGHDLTAMLNLLTDETRVIFIANPNNPTGTWLRSAELLDFLEQIPDRVLVVIDEAYSEFLDQADYPDAIQWISDFPNLVVTRTFSKAFGLAGLRAGYAVSHPEVADLLNRARQPFNVNNIAMDAACAALDDTPHLQRYVAINNEQREVVCRGLHDLGLRYVPSVANFVLADMGKSALHLFASMLRKGVIVRPVANYGLHDHLRISIGTPEDNDRMLFALRQVLEES